MAAGSATAPPRGTFNPAKAPADQRSGCSKITCRGPNKRTLVVAPLAALNLTVVIYRELFRSLASVAQLLEAAAPRCASSSTVEKINGPH